MADVTLELGVGVADKSGKVGDGTLVDNGLGEFLGMLSDLRESSSRDSLKSKLGLLDAKDKNTDSTGINNGLGKLVVVLGDAGESKSSGFLDGGVEFLEA